MTDFSWLAVYDLNQMLDLASAIDLSSGMSSQETQLTRAPVRQLAGRSDQSLHLHSRHDYLELASATWSRSHRRLATTEFQLARDSNVQPSTCQSVSTLLIIYCFNRWNVQVVNSNFKTIKFNDLCRRVRPVDSLTPTEGGVGHYCALATAIIRRRNKKRQKVRPHETSFTWPRNEHMPSLW